MYIHVIVSVMGCMSFLVFLLYLQHMTRGLVLLLAFTGTSQFFVWGGAGEGANPPTRTAMAVVSDYPIRV